MSYGYIYKITFPNGKCYIGLTARTIEQRRKGHNCKAKSGDTKCLYNALRKYDIVDNFQMIEIDTAETKEELCEKEIAHIEIHNSHYIRGNGYNMTDGGESNAGYEYTEEDRRKNSEALKKYYEDNPEAIQKKSEALKKYYEDNPEAIQKNSEALKKYYEDNPEAIQKNSEAQKKYNKDNPELRKKILDSKGQNKPFNVFKKDGTYIKSFDYQFEAMEYLQKTYDIKTRIKISAVLKGTRNYSHDFVFKYKE